MTLSPGTLLGPYEIESAIGAGGMGEVYRARDTRLDRSVAIKILPPAFSADPDRRARFEREAKTIAGLTHPHICTLHDVGEHDGSTFLVMEHLQGETLAARLTKGPLPLEQALTVATEIADALSAAHRQGVIHRDLKPGNVLLTKAGAKLLDFGLAKLKGHGEQPAAAHLASAPTQSTPLTAEGMIVGTLQYMAPEQLEGKPSDARTDLWALGAILYEMVTGKQAFEGASAASLITAIMSAEPPPLSTLQPLTPPSVDRLVRQSLAKAADDRPDTAHDVANDLRWLSQGFNVDGIAAAPRVHRTGYRERIAWALAAVALLALGASVLFRGTPTPSVDVPPARLSILLPTGVNLAVSSFSILALSPNGRTVAFAGDTRGGRQLFVRHLDRLEAEPVAGTEGGATLPFFSPDASALGFWLPTGALMQVPLAGGPPTVLGQHPGIGGAAWSPEGAVISGSALAGLKRFRPGQEEPEDLTKLSGARESAHVEPQLLPDGSILFVIQDLSRREEHNEVAVFTPRDRQVSRILKGVSSPRYVPDGYLLFARGRTLRAIRFDPVHLKVTGDETILAEDLSPSSSEWFYSPAGFDVASRGPLVYLPAPKTLDSRLALVDRSGREETLSSRIEPCTGVAAAPDGKRLAVHLTRLGGTEIQTVEIERDNWTRVSYGADHGLPAWTPDGSRVVFASNRDGYWGVYSAPPDGSKVPEPLTTGANVSAQGQAVTIGPAGECVFTATGSGGEVGLWARKTGRDNAVELLSARTLGKTGNPYVGGVFSPSGRLLAYLSRDTGGLQAYLRDFPALVSMWNVSTEGAIELHWSRDGSELFFGSGSKIMSVRVTMTPQVRVGRPQQILDVPGLVSFDVMPDGRFVTVRSVGKTAEPQVIVIPDWRRLLPSK